MRLGKFLLCVMTVTLFSFTDFKNSNSISGDWYLLGDKNVDNGVDHSVIYFANWSEDVSKIKLKMEGYWKIHNIKIHFVNEVKQDVTLRLEILKESESDIIDLVGGLRHISRIEFWHSSISRNAKVAVWGRN